MTNKFTKGTVNRAYILSDKAISIDVTFNDLIKIYSLKIVKGKNGVFIGKPSVKGKDGTYFNVCFFNLTPECETSIFSQVIDLLGESAVNILNS